MTTAYRTAIVGTGTIADAHARAVHALPERARVVAAVDVDVPRAKEFARRWDVPRIYANAAELLADGDVDLVHVCTPPRSHLSIALECLTAGVTVLVEKPPVLSLSEMDTLIEAENRSPARVASVFQLRFGSAAVRLRHLAADGVLGRPLVATCHTLWYRDDEYFAAPWRGSWADEGGGPTMGHGIHQSPRETSALRFDFEHATVEVEHLYGYRDTMRFIAAMYESAFTGLPVHYGQTSPAFTARMNGTGAPWQNT